MKIIYCLILLLIFSELSAKNIQDNDLASISGFVKDAKTKETLIGATIRLKNTKKGVRTNKNGYFSISDIPINDYVIVISFLGYENVEEKISFKKINEIRMDFELNPSSISTQEISVEADRDIEKRQITISKVNVPIQQIKEIRIGGESDVFRSLQYLPGVLTSSQVSSGLFVRGGSPDQNLVLLDGATVYNPTHLFGFISSFNTEAIKDVELVKGGFDAEYGGRLSAVLNLTQKEGNQQDYQGNLSLGVISSRLGVEGPIGDGSFFISGRRTYLDLILGLMPEDPTTPFPNFNFYDLNAKITQNLSSDDKLSLSGFLSQDNLLFSSFGLDMNLTVGNKLLSSKYTHIFSNDLFFTANLTYSNYYNRFAGDQSGYQFLIDNQITDYTFKSNIEYFLSDETNIKFGTEITGYEFLYLQNFTGDTDSTQSGSSAGSTNLTINEMNYSSFMQFKTNVFDDLSIQGGLRVNYWQLSKLFLLDPRFSMRYTFTDNFKIKAAWGIFHQNLRLATQPDFSFFDTWLPTDSTVPASKSTHYILSLETEPFSGYDLNFDVYYKNQENISELNTTAMKAATVNEIFYMGNSEAWGAEIFLQKKYGKFTGWFGYALGFIESKFDSINNGKSFRPKYDRTHDFKIVGSYSLNDSWDFGATFLYQTGQSYTGATSRMQTIPFPNQDVGRGKIVPSQRYGLRLPASHQLNVYVAHNFKLFGLEAKGILDIYNIYNRRDILMRIYNTREEVTVVEDIRLIPILPTLSLEVKF